MTAMRPLVRLVLTFFVLVFVAGTIVQATAAANMKMDMAMAMPIAAGAHMPGCDDCKGDPDKGLACITACTLPALGLLIPTVSFAPAVKAHIHPALLWAIVGESRAPKPYPPKPSVLN